MQVQLIELTPTTNPVGWEICTDSKCGSNSGYPDIDLPKDSGQQVIIFSINAPPGSGIKFPAKGEDAIYIQPGSKPTNKVYDTAGQLGAPKVSKNKLVLTLSDKNKGQPIDFHYKLNFVGAPAIDPVIKNGGGVALQMPVLQTAALLLGAVIVGALLYAGLRRLFGK